MAQDFQVASMGKIVFLLLQGHVPTHTSLQMTRKSRDPQLIARFDRETASRHARAYKQMHEYAVDEARINGVAPTPAQLADTAERIWDKYESEVQR